MTENRAIRPTRKVLSPRTARRDLPPEPRLRLVILNFNGYDLTLRALTALRGMSWPRDALEIVLVDNASSDGVVELVEREFPEVRIVRSEENRGFAGGNNLALRDLDGVDLVALVNNDVTVSPDWLHPLVEALRADPGLGAASPKMLLEGRYRRLDLATAPSRRDERTGGRWVWPSSK